MNGYILIIVIFIVLPLLNLFFAWKKDRSFVWFIAAFFLPVISTLLLILGPRRKEGEMIPPQVCIFILIIIFVFFVRIAEEELWTKKEAVKIITALDRYQMEHKQYPEELTELVPRYLSQVPAARILPSLLFGDDRFKRFIYYPDHVNHSFKTEAYFYYRVADIFPSRRTYDLRERVWRFLL